MVILVAVALAALVLAPEAFAAAGGGSSGFSGGGGGGGGGHGSGFAIYLLLQLLFRIALLGHGLGALFLIGIALLYFFLTRVVPHARNSGATGRRARRRTAKRERRVELAAAVAAEEDPAFAPDAVRANAT